VCVTDASVVKRDSLFQLVVSGSSGLVGAVGDRFVMSNHGGCLEGAQCYCQRTAVAFLSSIQDAELFVKDYEDALINHCPPPLTMIFKDACSLIVLSRFTQLDTFITTYSSDAVVFVDNHTVQLLLPENLPSTSIETLQSNISSWCQGDDPEFIVGEIAQCLASSCGYVSLDMSLLSRISILQVGNVTAECVKPRQPTMKRKYVNPYTIFSELHRPHLKALHPHLQNNEIHHLIGKHWKELSPEGKRSFVDDAELERNAPSAHACFLEAVSSM
jgi:HMG (high mobility group) box